MSSRASSFGRRRYMMKDEDFEEGDVWGVIHEEKENSTSPTPKKTLNKKQTESASSNLSRHVSSSSSPRMIPRSSSSSITKPPPTSNQQFSAPVDIPDWSKIYGKDSNKKKIKNMMITSSSWVYHHHGGDGYYANNDGDHQKGILSYGEYGNYGYDDHHRFNDDDGDDDDDEEEEDGMVPPHEFIARKLARSQISSFSVYEGIGRTLKGRDLSKLRNAILTKTGFLE